MSYFLRLPLTDQIPLKTVADEKDVLMFVTESKSDMILFLRLFEDTVARAREKAESDE